MLTLVLFHPLRHHSHEIHHEGCDTEQVHIESSLFETNVCFVCTHLVPFVFVLFASPLIDLFRRATARSLFAHSESAYFRPFNLYYLRGPPQF